MAKKQEPEIDLNEVAAAFGILQNFLVAQGVELNAETPAEEATEEAAAEEGETEAAVAAFPTVEEVEGLDEESAKAVFTTIVEGLDLSEIDEEAVKAHLTVAARINSDDTEVTKDEVNELLGLLGFEPAKKQSENIAALKELFATYGGEAPAAEEGEASESEETTEESSEETATEELSEEEQQARVDAYNAAAKSAKKKPVKDYDALVAALGDAEWGVPTVIKDEVVCCGLPMNEVEVDGVEQAAQCVVTEQVFSVSQDSKKNVSFEKVEIKGEASAEEDPAEEAADEEPPQEEEAPKKTAAKAAAKPAAKPAPKPVAKAAAKPVAKPAAKPTLKKK